MTDNPTTAATQFSGFDKCTSRFGLYELALMSLEVPPAAGT
jgi:hypothetical protein